jgi:hypothetical protein
MVAYDVRCALLANRIDTQQLPTVAFQGDSSAAPSAATISVVTEAAQSPPGDVAALARMRAAADTLRKAGVDVEPAPRSGDPADALLARAVFWQDYSRGPGLPARHRSCAADIARGSLRLWAAAGGVPTSLPPRSLLGRSDIALARVQLCAQARRMCSRLRADLGQEAADLSLRGGAAFGARVRGRVTRAATELDEAVSGGIAALGLPSSPAGAWDVPVEDCLPPRRRCALENRLTTALGAGLGAGVSVSLARLATELRPGAAPAAVAVCVLLGVALTSCVVLARRLLSERAAAERWVAEVVANLRPVMEERVLRRMASAESAARR